tara:strand:+ start:311 stop:985 length:675 start_codon:yes stop_codon:yes gene_type:complete
MKGQMSSVTAIILVVIMLLAFLGAWTVIGKGIREDVKNRVYKWGEGEGIDVIDGTKKPVGESDFKDVLTTHYFISHRKFFNSYNSFRSTVYVEGAGIYEKEGEEYVLSFDGENWGDYKRKGSKKENGLLAYSCGGTTPTEHRTIAVAPKMIEKCSKVYVYFGDCEECKKWNGCYVAEDTGGKMRSDWEKGIAHIDLFVGIGRDGKENDPVYELPRKSELWVGKC